MGIAEQAFRELYPDKELEKYSFDLKYSGKFSGYNANIRVKRAAVTEVMFSMSRKWEEVSEEIQQGLLQQLLQRVFGKVKKTTNMDLYDMFIKNVHVAVEKHEADDQLLESFDRVNEQYFLGLMERPNLVWGNASFRKLGSYSYGEDKVMMSTIFQGISEEEKVFLDYVMYHELLHKKHKFRSAGMKNHYHHKEFLEDEKKFTVQDIERKLMAFVKGKRGGSFSWGKLFTEFLVS